MACGRGRERVCVTKIYIFPAISHNISSNSYG